MTAETTTGLPLVAVVGRPNVGKSSLVNRVLQRREAIVEETPGVTRDRHSFIADWRGRTFELVDTGGLEPGAEGLDARVAEQAHVAIEAADVVLLVVDAATGPLQDDLEVAELLRGSDTPVLVVANKVDDPRDEPLAAAFHRLGLGDPVPVSALHGRGSGDLLDRVYELLPDVAAEGTEAYASVAIVGRPNVGKSSTLNALLGTERSIVHHVPGTTRDPVDSYVRVDDQLWQVVDTAGMRREVDVKEGLEFYSLLRSRRAVERADVALLVIDCGEGVTGLDQRIAEAIVESGRACVVLLNKWDLAPKDETDRARFEADIEAKLRFLPWAERLRSSARTKRGIHRIVPSLQRAVTSHRTRLTTSVVNDIVGDAQRRRPHPRSGGRSIRILYGVQASVAPPRFVVFTNGRLENSYVRYLENRIREREAFEGSPMRIETRMRKARDGRARKGQA